MPIVIFFVAFVVILVVNQMFYGFCFESRCLSAAFPKVLILASFVTYFLTKSDLK
mgnify:CR=1 FL=1